MSDTPGSSPVLGDFFARIRLDTSTLGTAIAGATQMFSKMGSDVEGALTGVGESASKGPALAIGAMAVAVGAVAVESTKMAGEFQANMERLHTQAGVAQGSIKGLSSDVLALAGKVGEDPRSLADALYHVESSFAGSGKSGKEMMDILKVASEGARVGGANLVDVTNAMDAAIVSGIPGVQNYQQAMGALNATVGAGDMSMQNLAEALGTGVLASIKGYGVTLRDASAALAVFGDNNIRGSTAGNQLRMTVQSLAVPTKQGVDNLKSLGMTTDGLAKDMQEHGLSYAMDDLSKRMTAAGITGNKTGEFLTETFGKRAGVGVSILMGQLDRFHEKFNLIDQGASKFGESWAATQQTFKQKTADAHAALTALGIQIGQVLLPITGHLADAFTTVAPILGTVLVGAIHGLQTAVHAVAAPITTTFGWLTDKKNRDAVVALATVLTVALGPALIRMGVQAAISAGQTAALFVMYRVDSAVAAARFVASSFMVVAGWAAQGAAAMASGAASAAGWVIATGPTMIAAVASFLVGVATTVAGWVAMAAAAMGDALVMAAAWLVAIAPIAIVIAAVVGLAVLIYENWGNIKKWTAEAWDAVVGFVKRAWDDVSGAVWNGIQTVIRFVSGLQDSVLHILGDIGSWLVHAGSDLIDGLINGISGAASRLWNFITGFIKANVPGPILKFLGISSPSKLMASYGAYIAQGLANGMNAGAGIVSRASLNLGGAALSGLSLGTSIGDVNLGMTASAGGSSSPAAVRGGTQITQIIQAVPYTPQQVATEAVNALAHLERVHG